MPAFSCTDPVVCPCSSEVCVESNFKYVVKFSSVILLLKQDRSLPLFVWEHHPVPAPGNNLSGVPCGFGETTEQGAPHPWPRSGNITNPAQLDWCPGGICVLRGDPRMENNRGLIIPTAGSQRLCHWLLLPGAPRLPETWLKTPPSILRILSLLFLSLYLSISILISLYFYLLGRALGRILFIFTEIDAIKFIFHNSGRRCICFYGTP